MKQRFDDVYNCSLPNQYFLSVAESEYVLPDQVRKACTGLFEGEMVVDLGSGYGANALLDRLDGWDWLKLVTALSSGEPLPKLSGRNWCGVDHSGHALDWAVKEKVFDSVVVQDLTATPTTELLSVLNSCDLVLATGVFGYIGPDAPVLDAIKSRCVFTLLGWEDSFLWLDKFTQRGWKASLVSVVAQRRGSQDELISMRAAVDGHDARYSKLVDAGWLPAEVWIVTPPPS